MRGEVEAGLIDLLQSVMGFADTLRDAGTTGDISVRLNRADGLRLLQIVSGVSDPEAEEWSQRDRPKTPGVNSLKVADVIFEWPRADVASQRPEPARLFSTRPGGVGAPMNDNSDNPGPNRRFYGFQED